MSQKPESVPFMRRILQISLTSRRWLLPARHTTIVNRCANSSFFLPGFIKSFLLISQGNLSKE